MISVRLLSELLNTNVIEVYIRKGAMRFKTSNDRGNGWVSDSDTPIPPIHELSDKAIDWIESQGFWIKKEHKTIYALIKGSNEVYGIDTKNRIDVPFMCMQWILDNKK